MWHGMYFALWEEWFLLSSSICETRTVTTCETWTVMWCFYWALVFAKLWCDFYWALVVAKLWCDVFISHVAWNVFCALGRMVFISICETRTVFTELLYLRNCDALWLFAKRELWCDVFIELLYLRNCDVMFLYHKLILLIVEEINFFECLLYFIIWYKF